MTSTRFLLLVLSCVALIHFTKQEEGCEPRSVVNLTLRGNNTLTWERSPDEECELGYYLVQIAEINGTIHLSYNVLFPVVHITLLERCKSYTFRVFQVSQDNITGPAEALFQTTPPASDANLHLEYVSLTQEDRNVRLAWGLEDQYISCARYYRVVVYNEDSDIVHDVYTAFTSTTIIRIVPCAHYTFAIRAIFTLEEEGPATVVRHTAVAFPATAPHLASVSLGSTTSTFTWHLEEYAVNRCDMSALSIDASPYFNVTYPIRTQVDRTPLNLRLTGLSPDTMYYLKVAVSNTAGSSALSQMAIQTLAAS